MAYLASILGIRHRRIGLIFVRERGLDLEVWDSGSCPCWSMGVVHTDMDASERHDVTGIPPASQWLLILPTYLCTTRSIHLPASRPEEIAAMLEFEVPQLAPCRTQAWTWDFCVTDVHEDGVSQVLVVLSPLSVVESALEQAQAWGIEPSLVTISAALDIVKPTRRDDGEERTLRGHVSWDYGSLDFSATEGSRLMFLRGARVCGQNSHTLECAQAEVGRSLSILRERGLAGDRLAIRVGGDNPDLASLVERLGQYEGVLVEPKSTSSWPAASTHVPCINLLPQHRKEKDRRAARRRELLGTGLRVCVLALLMLLCLRMSSWRQTRLLGQYQQRIARIAPLAQKLQFLQGQLAMIQAQVQGSVSMLDIISQIYELLPKDVTIHHLSIDQNRQVILRAQARLLSQAFDCIDPLERSAYLVNVRQNYAHLRELDGQVLIDFELRADLEKRPAKEAGL
jgi:type II secretory pathway component PulL